MRILALAPSFPSESHPFAGIFTARIVATLQELGHSVETLCPRPFVPPGFEKLGRWKQYGSIPRYSEHEGVPVHRPATVVVPGIFGAFWSDQFAWVCTRHVAKSLHRKSPFDAVIGFDLGGAGGLAWRIAHDLKVPAAGWAYGAEVRVSPTSDVGKSVVKAMNQLDAVFYQSTELRECASVITGRDLSKDRRHHVLPHGIRVNDDPKPEHSPFRERWGVQDNEKLVLCIGRVIRDKGLFDLVDAFVDMCENQADLRLVIVGAMPPRDDSEEFIRAVSSRGMGDRIQVLGPITPAEVPDALAAADVFAFTSYLEGFPNVVLEALRAEVPIVAFDIPCLREADPHEAAIALVPLANAAQYSSRLIRTLSDDAANRERVAAGKKLLNDRFNMHTNLELALQLLMGTK